MSDLLIRNIESDVADELKSAASESGRSVQAEATLVLREWMRERKRRRDFWRHAREVRERIGPIPGDSTEYIREDRDTDHGRDVSGFRT
jgi:plasmid stability protein